MSEKEKITTYGFAHAYLLEGWYSIPDLEAIIHQLKHMNDRNKLSMVKRMLKKGLKK